MATQTLPHAVAFPQFVTAAKISQSEIVELIEARNTLAALEAHVAALESSMTSRLQAGIPVEPGVHVAKVQERSRRNVSWREVLISFASDLGYDGDKYASEVLAATAANRTPVLIID